MKAKGGSVKGMLKGLRTDGGHYKNGTKPASIFKALVTAHKTNIAGRRRSLSQL